MECFKNFVFALVMIVSFNLFSTAYAYETPKTSPIGYWRTIDDVTGKPKSIVQIWKTDENILMGRVVKIFPKVGESENKLCTACKGGNHNQPIVGMVILSKLKYQSPNWKGGQILDPHSGKTYRCALNITENGKKLKVHGYLGLPVFGRSQIWERVDLTS